MIKHTAGPWEPKGRFVMNREGNTLCEVKYPFPCGMTAEIAKATQEEHANARLIAAAPELLDALEDILAIEPDDEGIRYVEPSHMSAVHAAIAKATGEG